MTAAIIDAQGPGIADPIKTCGRAICAEEGATWRMTAHDGGSWRARWGGARRPQGSMDPASVSGMTTPTSISFRVTGKGGDNRFNLIWSRGSADLTPQDRRLAFPSGPELALVTMRLSAVASGADHSTRC